MATFLFGKKKRRTTRKKGSRKPPASLLRKCKKLKIKCTRKVGNRRVYRKTSILKKLVSKKMKMHRRKGRKVHRRRRVHRRSTGFGRIRKSRFGADFSNAGPSNYGYDQKVIQNPGILNQSSQIVTATTNDSRPTGLGLPGEFVPTYGVGRPFFNETVPTQVGPNWNFMGQPDGSAFAVGGPFVGYKLPASFGRGRRYNVAGSPCNRLRARICRSSPNCTYTKKGCRRRKGTVKNSMVYEGPSLR